MSIAKHMGLHGFTAQDWAAMARDPAWKSLLRMLERDRLRSQCGAKTRAGEPFKNPPATLWKSRCELHGETLDRPRTAEGRARIAEVQRKRWARWRGLTNEMIVNAAKT